jgi:hypothetical protein
MLGVQTCCVAVFSCDAPAQPPRMHRYRAVSSCVSHRCNRNDAPQESTVIVLSHLGVQLAARDDGADRRPARERLLKDRLDPRVCPKQRHCHPVHTGRADDHLMTVAGKQRGSSKSAARLYHK